MGNRLGMFEIIFTQQTLAFMSTPQGNSLQMLRGILIRRSLKREHLTLNIGNSLLFQYRHRDGNYNPFSSAWPHTSFCLETS